MSTQGEGTEYDRGHTAGEITARLAGHDQHFRNINGSIDKLADELHELRLVMQKLADRETATDERARHVATALREADAERRVASEYKWSGYQKLAVGAGGLAGIATLITIIYSLFH